MMIWIDYVIVGLIVFSALISLYQGFAQEALSILTWGGAFFIASNFYSYPAAYFTYFQNTLTRNSISIVILFIATLIMGAISNYVLSSLIEKTGILGTDRVLGVCFGAIRGVIIVAVIIFFLDTFSDFSRNADWKHSQLIPQFRYIISWLLDYFQGLSSFFIS